MEVEPYLIPPTEINLKYIKDLNVRPETIQFPAQNKGGKLLDMSLSEFFVGLTPKARETEQK